MTAIASTVCTCPLLAAIQQKAWNAATSSMEYEAGNPRWVNRADPSDPIGTVYACRKSTYAQVCEVAQAVYCASPQEQRRLAHPSPVMIARYRGETWRLAAIKAAARVLTR